MVAVSSTMLPLGTKAPPFSLPSTDGKLVSSAELPASPALLVMFICNHCPFVVHVRSELASLTREYQEKGVTIVGISSNDVQTHPADSPARMAAEARKYGYTFPYLFDESQEVAKAYRAACTPEFYLFDGKRELIYRGQFDDSRPGNGLPVTGRDLRAALDAVLEHRTVDADQKPSIGCNIKWKPGNAPDYFDG